MVSSNNNREAELIAFLQNTDWEEADRVDLAGDASSRRYQRLSKATGEIAVLMDAPPNAEAAACPADATPDERKALGYNALACLAGPDSAPFIAIACFLRENGFSAPEIFAYDLERGFLIIEDLGDDLFARIVNKSADETEIYSCAIDVLNQLHDVRLPQILPVTPTKNYGLHTYDQYALAVETDLLIDWYAPAAKIDLSTTQKEDYQAIWRRQLEGLATATPVLVLRDYHAENLIWLPRRQGAARVGLLDFQDGLSGHRAYDLVSLLQDARRDVSPELEAQMFARYCATASAQDPNFDQEEFSNAYGLLSLQRNAKIVGIFARLAKRDGKPNYLNYLPRVWSYIERSFEHESLAPLKGWFDKTIPANYRTRTNLG